MPQPFTPDDVFLHQTITDTDAQRGGTLLAFAVESIDREADSTRSCLWLADMAGGTPRQLTHGPADTTPRWSPDGTQLAFIAARSGTNQVWLLPLDGGEPRQLGALPGSVVSIAWRPDGRQLLATCALQVDPELRGARPPRDATPPTADAPQIVWRLPYKVDGMGYVLTREVHLFTLDADGGAHRQLTDGPFDVRGAQWSPDGSHVVFTRTREGDAAHRTDVWVARADGREARQLTTTLAQVLYPVWSPDGRWIVFSGTEAEGDAQVRLWCAEMPAGTVRGLGSEDLEVSSEGDSVHFPPGDGSRVLAVLARRGVQEVVEITVPGGAVRTLVGGDRQLAKLACGKDVLGYTGESPVAAMELYACRHDGADERQLGCFNGWWRERTQARMERRRFRVPDGDGGTEEIEGWLVRPEGAQGAGPLLVDAHGGPASYVLFNYPPIAYWTVLWSRGWSILALNAVGSASYGRRFADRLRGRWGELDLPQLHAAVEQLQAQGETDARVAIAGKSYGGFMAAWAIGTRDGFRAAAVMAPVANLETHYATSDSGFYADPYSSRGERTVNRETMRRLSPTQHVEKARTPTLILHGAEDERTPLNQSEELFVAMRRGANPPCELVIYPGATHKFTSQGKPSHRADAMRRIADWLGRHVTD